MDWDSKGINTACPLFSKFIHNHNRPDDDNQHPPQGGASEPQQVVGGKTGCSQSALTMHISGKLTGRQKQHNSGIRWLERLKSTFVRQKSIWMNYSCYSGLHGEWTKAGVRALITTNCCVLVASTPEPDTVSEESHLDWREKQKLLK